MKWPSLESLYDDTKQVILRFPLQVVVTLLAILTCFTLIDFKGNTTAQWNLLEVLFLCNLALVLLLSADLFAEANKLDKVKQWGLRLLCLAVCALLYFTLQPHLNNADKFRIGLLAFSFHLLVAFAPFIKQGNLHGFWEYNKLLFLRILMAGLYAAVLFAGLSIALVAINGLFNVKIESAVYLRLLTVVGIGFTTLFFLAGVPADFNKINTTQGPYPKGLKIFTQYVLIPLLTIYLVILLVYEAKILISWELPKGMVSTLILGYSVFGVLSLLLVYPIKEQEGNGWIRLFSRWFYLMMIPLVVLLLLAVWKRVSNYGITEPRYILIILALWLSIITGYFLISRKDNIKIIPVSLCILALLATYGPQSAFSVSRYSQTQRLKKLINAKDAPALREKPEIIRYLVLNHGLETLQPFTNADLQQVNQSIEQRTNLLKRSSYQQENDLVDTAYALLKINKATAAKGRRSMVSFVAREEGVVAIKGFDYVIPVNSYALKFDGTLNGTPLNIDALANNEFHVKMANEPLLVIDTKPAADAIRKAYLEGKLIQKANGNNTYLPDNGISINANGKRYIFTLLITELTLSLDEDWDDGSYNYKGFLLVKIK